MTYTAEISGATIVLIGSFNPAILTPDWLEMNGLIGSEDARVAREPGGNFVVSREVTALETDWFAIQALEDQLTFSSKGALSLNMRDLAAGICSLVPHTPVKALGLNFFGHFRIPSAELHHKIGDTLAPKNIWNELLDPQTQSIGLTNLSMRIQPFPRRNPTSSKDAINIQVQNSSKIEYGVLLSWNDHREMFAHENSEKNGKAEVAGQIVKADWEESWQRSLQFFSSLLIKVTA